MTRPLTAPPGLAGDGAGGVVVGRAVEEQQVKARPAAPERARRAASGTAVLPGSVGAVPVEASGGASAATAPRVSVGVREASAAPASVVAVRVASVVAVRVANAVGAPAANGVEVAVVRAVSGLLANAVEARANAEVGRASGAAPANEVGGARTGPAVMRRPAPCTPSGSKSVVGESNCTAIPASSW